MPRSLLEPRGLLSGRGSVSHILHSSERQDWRTPPWFLALVRASSPDGRIALDPATHWTNPAEADSFFSAPPIDMEQGPEGIWTKAPPRLVPGFRPGQGPALWLGPCGLAGSWTRVRDSLRFTNPPYGDHLDGEVDPAREVFRTNKETKVREVVGVGIGWAARIAQDTGSGITLVPNRTETQWWERLFYASHLIVFVKKRIPFVNADTGKVGASPNHGSTVFYRGTRPDLFARAFSPVGIVNPGGLCP